MYNVHFIYKDVKSNGELSQRTIMVSDESLHGFLESIFSKRYSLADSKQGGFYCDIDMVKEIIIYHQRDKEEKNDPDPVEEDLPESA